MEDYEEYNDDYNENVENMFGQERNVYERVGMRGDVNVDIDMIGMDKKTITKNSFRKIYRICKCNNVTNNE